MGWSCTAAANRILETWTKACIAQTGTQNTYTVRGTEYFFEVSRTEHDDGAITGTIQKVVRKDPDGRAWCQPAGSFRIGGDGRVVRAPAFLKSAA